MSHGKMLWSRSCLICRRDIRRNDRYYSRFRQGWQTWCCRHPVGSQPVAAYGLDFVDLGRFEINLFYQIADRKRGIAAIVAESPATPEVGIVDKE